MVQPNQQSENQPNQSQNEQNRSQSLAHKNARHRGELMRQGKAASPFSMMRRFNEEMNSLFDDFGLGGSMLSPDFSREFEQMAMWTPQTEVFERGDQLVVRADLPGITKDNVNVDIEDDQIIIQGERRNEQTKDERGFYHTERSYGSFYRAIPLPKGVDSEQAKANFDNGVLEITMPKPERKSRGKRLEIGTGNNQTKVSNE